jgi:hypothetical protein
MSSCVQTWAVARGRAPTKSQDAVAAQKYSLKSKE